METRSQPKRLYRSGDRILGGVLAGFAEYIYADKTVVRLLYALVSILSAGFPGLLIYIVAWIVIPERPLEN
ncbi:MAG: PspC domain-containing protein [Mariniphaga sp.]|jgi:phage shock protein C|nr:PspC domain-containing protein [Mariniphaga sp.]